jgi:hypothetical protein
MTKAQKTNQEDQNGLTHIFDNESVQTDTPKENTPFEAEHTPSWFLHKQHSGIGDALAERYQQRRQSEHKTVETPGPEAYEDYKRKLDGRFSQAQQNYDNPVRPPMRPTLPISDIHGRRRLYQQEQLAHMAEQKNVRGAAKSPTLKMLSLGLIALAVGGGAGFAVLNHDTLSSTFTKGVSSIEASMEGFKLPSFSGSKHSSETVITKKPVATASLQVNDARGTLNSLIPLMLTAQATDGADAIALKVMGLPPESYLTKGIETTKGNWLLKPEDIAGVQLVVPQIESKQFDVEIAAVEAKSGVLAAPVKALTVEIADAAQPATQVGQSNLAAPQEDLFATIAPAAAPPDTSTQTSAASTLVTGTGESVALITKGDSLLSTGDLASARQFYLRASELGDANGAYGVGRTYDPKIYAALNVQGLSADPEKAAVWYKKAKDAGVEAAKTALDSLEAAK